MVFFISFMQSIIYQYLTIVFEKRFAIFTDCNTKAHGVHKVPTPRVGGIGIFLAFAVSVFLFADAYWWLVVSSGLIFTFGLYEDWHGDTKKLYRLSVMALSALMAIYLGGYVADDLGIIQLPYLLAVVFTVVGTVGMSSAVNFIDGLNGLASGVVIVIVSFFGMVLYIHDATGMLPVMYSVLGATCGFFIWNYPHGKIFLGDGGAYFLGFLLAFLSVIVVSDLSVVSPAYPLVALSYPLIETLVTIHRRINRKKNKNIPFFEAERVHLHTLKFKRRTRDNAEATKRILIFHFFINFYAFVFHQYFWLLMLALPVVYVIYIYKYKKMVQFRESSKPWKNIKFYKKETNTQWKNLLFIKKMK